MGQKTKAIFGEVGGVVIVVFCLGNHTDRFEDLFTGEVVASYTKLDSQALPIGNFDKNMASRFDDLCD